LQTFKVGGMTCASCERAVTSAVQGIDPQAQVEVDLGAGLVKTDSDASAERLEKAIEAEGYQAQRVAIPA
jgi:copper chaperone